MEYHDSEWGVPVHDDRIHFEFLILESAQAGLSWLTITRKREGYRRAFSDFDPEKVVRYDRAKIEALMQNPEIIRNRRKIESAVKNARLFMDLQAEYGSFSSYLWGFVDGRPVVGEWERQEDVPASTPLSERISKDLKERGFTFLGPVIVYSHLQATGVVNDHVTDCFRFREICGSYSDQG
jgi:DNA-3-methyladenine glycosylase I